MPPRVSVVVILLIWLGMVGFGGLCGVFLVCQLIYRGIRWVSLTPDPPAPSAPEGERP